MMKTIKELEDEIDKWEIAHKDLKESVHNMKLVLDKLWDKVLRLENENKK